MPGTPKKARKSLNEVDNFNSKKADVSEKDFIIASLAKSKQNTSLCGEKNIPESDSKPEKQACLEKVHSRHEELKIAITNLRQAFVSYKVCTYFYPTEFEFCKSFNEDLQKSEECIVEMGQKLAKFRENHLNLDMTIPKPEEIENHNAETCQEKVSGSIHPGSLTPPSSEFGNDEGLESDSSNTRKRKSEPASEDRVIKRRSKVRNSKSSKENCLSSVPINPSHIKSFSPTKPVTPSPKKNEENPNTKDDSDEDDGRPADVYEVETINDYLKKQGKYLFCVSWKGYSSADNTFEPLGNLINCDTLLVDFLIERIRARLKAKTALELKDLPIPVNTEVKDFLYQAFTKVFLPYDPNILKETLKTIESKKPNSITKPKEECLELVLRFFSYKDPTLEKYRSTLSNISTHIIYEDIKHQREKQLANLRTWERKMNSICSDPAPLTVENSVDLSLPPKDFVYINDCMEGPGIKIPNDPFIGCTCSEDGCHSGAKKCCPDNMESHFAYNKYKRLRVSLGTPIYECNKKCQCGPSCNNRVVQKGRLIRLSIFRTENGRGWGVKALEAIKKDTFVTEYVGEVISSEDAEKRGMEYDAQGCTYLFDLDYNKGDLNPYTIDAAKYGNVSHFINHSCDPNLVVFNVWVNCLDPDLPKLGLFATKDIKKGEELTFDYNSNSTLQKNSNPILDISGEDEMLDGNDFCTPIKLSSSKLPFSPSCRKTPKQSKGKTVCRCGAPNCRKFFF